MTRRDIIGLFTVLTLGLGVLSGGAIGQQTADTEGVESASKAFYAALSANDNGEAIGKAWVHAPYVTNVGPRSQSVLVGWDAIGRYWIESKKRFSKMDVTLADQHIHVNGNLAWEMGLEGGTLTLKDGKEADYLVTNVYEKIDGNWLMVSHHVQPKPE